MAEEAEWIEWSGGECPVADNAIVDVRFRSRDEWHNDRADQLFDSFCRSFWEHKPGNQSPDDITAYRVVAA